MRLFHQLLMATGAILLICGCDALNSLTNRKMKSAQGRPYEMVVVCDQTNWDGALGDSLRAILTAPIPYLNQTEPLFDVLRVNPRGFSGPVADHRNIMTVLVDPQVATAAMSVQYDKTAAPQIFLSLQGPTAESLVEYLSQNRTSVVQALEGAERDRANTYAKTYNEKGLQDTIRATFGVEMKIPSGYILAKAESDFVWARFEHAQASQGFFVYSYPYAGPQSLTQEALIAVRNSFAARIPGPSAGSYMTTSDILTPSFRMFQLEGRLWCELRGFWDVAGDFMGGPMVSYTTVDTQTNRLFTLDCYVFSPNLHKRNFLRGVEHLLYSVEFAPVAKPE